MFDSFFLTFPPTLEGIILRSYVAYVYLPTYEYLISRYEITYVRIGRVNITIFFFILSFSKVFYLAKVLLSESSVKSLSALKAKTVKRKRG